MAGSDLHHISATEAIARFKARTLSPVELITAVIARAEAVMIRRNNQWPSTASRSSP